MVESGDREVETRMVIDAVLDEFNEDHRRVIDLHVFGGLPAKDVCARMEGMTPDNVAQICSRFRKRLRTRLDLEEIE